MGNNITKPNPVTNKYANMEVWHDTAQFFDPLFFNLANNYSIDMRNWPSSIYFFNIPFTQDILYSAYVTIMWTVFFLGWFLYDLWNQTKFAAQWPEQTLGGEKAPAAE